MSRDAPDLTRRAQMPGLLGRLDDPWGITWRMAGAARRFSPRRTVRFLAAWILGTARFERPIFVTGAPRSGTTLVFQLLRSSPELGSLPGEGHDIWRRYHHPRRRGWRSDAVGAGEVGFGERRFVNAAFHAHVGRRRLVEKTPESSLRIPYLLDLFPDALFVFVHRHPCEVINSLINGWRHPQGRFRSYFVPEKLSIPGYPASRRWCFALVDGWRELRDRPIPEIALAQWEQCLRGLAAGRSAIPAGRLTEIHLERLVEDPRGHLERLTERLGIDCGESLAGRLRELLAEPVNALSPARPEKWKDENRDEISALLPRIARVAELAGYRVDPVSGDVTLP